MRQAHGDATQDRDDGAWCWSVMLEREAEARCTFAALLDM